MNDAQVNSYRNNIIESANALAAQLQQAEAAQAKLERIVDELVDIANVHGEMVLGPRDLAGYWRGRANDLERERRRMDAMDALNRQLKREVYKLQQELDELRKRRPGSERTQFIGRINELEQALGAEREAHARTRLGYERSQADLEREVEALKATPPRVEREVDRGLRAALSSHLEWTDPDLYVAGSDRRRAAEAISAWLAAPLPAAPAHDEYTKAAVAFAESWAEDGPSPFDATGRVFKALYDARKRGEASAAEVEASPAEKRVTLYALLGSDGSVSELLGTDQGVKLYPGGRLLALTATVVREGGAQ